MFVRFMTLDLESLTSEYWENEKNPTKNDFLKGKHSNGLGCFVKDTGESST